MILLAHPTGNANIRNAAVAMLEAGLLGEFWTAIAWRTGGALDSLLPRSVRSHLARRAFAEIPPALVRTAPFREFGRFAAPQLGLGCLTKRETGFFNIDSVYRSFSRTVAKRIRSANGLRAVYTGEDCALEAFEAARALGWRRFYDLPIGYWRAGHAIYREEAERQPEWASTLGGMNDSELKLQRKDAELACADTVIVASSYTRRTLEDAPTRVCDVCVIPYGSPPVPAEKLERERGGKLRVLFAGALGQRKGLAYLLEAMRRMRGVAELTLLGRKTSEACRPLDEALREHRWIPSLPHHEVLDEMGRHDVLVFPSLFEGFGLVITEALSRGLPVITTAHTGGPDLITEGADGFIIPIRSADAIADRLELLAGNRELLAEMQLAARETAKRRTWAGYRRGLAEALVSRM